MTDNELTNQGRQAAEVLENPAFKAGIDAMRNVVTQQWKTCAIHDTQEQLLLLQLAKLTDKFESILSGYVQGGKLAQEKINLNTLRNESYARQVMRRVL